MNHTNRMTKLFGLAFLALAGLMFLGAGVSVSQDGPEVLKKRKKTEPEKKPDGEKPGAEKPEDGEKKPDPEKKPEPAAKKPEPEKKEEPKKEESKNEGEKVDPNAEKIKEIIGRLHGNFDQAEERLDKKDTGKDTVKIQDDIIRDLDELLKQNQNQGGGGGGGGGSSSNSKSSSSKSSSSKSSSSKSSSSKSGSSGQGSQNQPQGAKNDSKDPKGGADQKKNDDQDKLGKKDDEKRKEDKGGPDKKEQTADNKNDDKKKENEGPGMGGKGKDGKNTIADLAKDPWGYLPQKKRQEMEAYSKERFLPKYEEILRQYYRTISEQARGKGND